MKKRVFWLFDDNFKIPTFLSVASFYKYCKVEINLVFYGQDVQAVKELFSNLKIAQLNIEHIPEHFFTFPVEPFNENFRSHIRNRELRFYIAKKANKADELIYLIDSDIVFNKGIEQLFDLVFPTPSKSIIWGNIEHTSTKYNKFFFNRKEDADYIVDKKEIEQKVNNYLYGPKSDELLEGPQFNNGILILYKTEQLIDLWEHFYKKSLKIPYVNAEDDQVPLAIACQLSEVTLVELPDFYNSRGKLRGEYAAYHAFYGKWKGELINALIDIPFIVQGLSETARIYRDNLLSHPNLDAVKSKFLIPNQPKLFYSVPSFFYYESLYNQFFQKIPVGGNFVILEIRTGKSLCYLAELKEILNKNVNVIGFKKNKPIINRPLPLNGQPNVIKESSRGRVKEKLEERGLDHLVKLKFTDLENIPSSFQNNSIDVMVFESSPISIEKMYNTLIVIFPKIKPGGMIAAVNYIWNRITRIAFQKFAKAYNLSLVIKKESILIHKIQESTKVNEGSKITNQSTFFTFN